MANEEKKDNVVEMNMTEVEAEEKKSEETKTDEPKKKGNPITRFFKGCWNGAKKVGGAVNSFVHEHPYVTAGITTGAGYILKMGLDLLNGNSEEVSTETSLPELPEASSDDCVEPEDNSIEIDLPEIETTEE